MRKITVVVYNSDKPRDRYDRPEKLVQYVKWLSEKLDSIPEEFRDSAEVTITGNDYSCDYCISYTRPESPEEENARLANLSLIQKRQRDRELATLAELKAKYEPQ